MLNDLVKVSVSRLIPAKKYQVIRFITKVADFPKYIPSIKEVSVLKRKHNHLVTDWHIEVGKVPIKWAEEEVFDLKNGRIDFFSLKGDLDKFKGRWQFFDDPQGTRVLVEAQVEVNIPAIKEFAKPYIESILKKNFGAILRAAEKHLVSLKYIGYRNGNKEKIAGFGVVGHFYNFYHLENCLRLLNPAYKMPSREFLSKLFQITPSFKMYDRKGFKSKTGQSVDGCFILATFIPDMIKEDMWTVFSKVVRACKIAEKQGVGIVTLGGFASIVAERIGHQIINEVDVPVTTGNTFTAAMVVEGVLKAASLLGLDVSSSEVAIVGGTGDIGSACARVLADKAQKLTITGRTKVNLKRLHKELARKKRASILSTTDNKKAVSNADIVIAAASTSASILEINWFKPGAIIADVGYPKNISYAPAAREDLFIFSGGLTKTPSPLSFPIDTGLPDDNITYGCFAEAIILSLEKRYQNYSFGRGRILPEKIEEISALGKKHGFEVSDFYWGNKLVGLPEINKIKAEAKALR